jgi:hypothetical protein
MRTFSSEILHENYHSPRPYLFAVSIKPKAAWSPMPTNKICQDNSTFWQISEVVFRFQDFPTTLFAQKRSLLQFPQLEAAET